MKGLILRSFQSPGDVVMLTAAVRDLHAAHPQQFQTDVRTSADALFENNPHRTPLSESTPGVRTLDMHYPLIHHSNQRPFHFIHGYAQFLEDSLGLRIPVTRFHGDVHLSPEEKRAPPPGGEYGVPKRYWIMVAGGKYDFTAKWWNPSSYQQVVDHFLGRITFVQCGEQGHWHPRLQQVVDLVGKTTLREFVRLMYHADGVVCPVTLAMHLAPAVETTDGVRGWRPCVVIAGGREPAHWEAYPNHRYLSTNGALPCCRDGGCWRSRCQLVGDGDPKDTRDVCQCPVRVSADLRIAKCMDMIRPDDVVRAIEVYYEGSALSDHPPVSTGTLTDPTSREHAERTPPLVSAEPAQGEHRRLSDAGAKPHAGVTLAGHVPASARDAIGGNGRARNVLLQFRHGLGDAVQLTVVLKHLRHYHPDWNVDVAALVGKHSAYAGLCRQAFVLDRDGINHSAYDQVLALDWHEARSGHVAWPSTKPSRCLLDVFGLEPVPELCRYEIRVGARARAAAARYLHALTQAEPDREDRFPAVLIHYQGNTSGDSKDLPHDLVRQVCEEILSARCVPIILDWDRRSPLVDGLRIHNPNADHELWGGTGTGDAETLAALIAQSRLLIGVDSGPLHVAGATRTPTIGVWTRHHPVHFFDLAENVTHLVPTDHARLVHGAEALAYFASAYRHRVYRQLYVELPALLESQLTGGSLEHASSRHFLRQLRSTGYTQQYYEEHKLAGLDYLGFGDWQRQYGRWFVESLGLNGKWLLDVGCACGAILRGLGEAGAIVQGVDINEHMIRLGREKWPDMAPLLFTCDAVNLHLYADESWDAIHTAQVAEHWKPELVPHILREFWRVVRPGGLLFCALDTEELLARQGRRSEAEDPTHHCLRPLAWWHQQLAEAGWEECSKEFEPAMCEHRESFLKRYDWDWFVARRGEEVTG